MYVHVSDGSGPSPNPGPTQARPFLEGLSPVLKEGPKPGSAQARRQKHGGLEGLLWVSKLTENWKAEHYLYKSDSLIFEKYFIITKIGYFLYLFGGISMRKIIEKFDVRDF